MLVGLRKQLKNNFDVPTWACAAGFNNNNNNNKKNCAFIVTKLCSVVKLFFVVNLTNYVNINFNQYLI